MASSSSALLTRGGLSAARARAMMRATCASDPASSRACAAFSHRLQGASVARASEQTELLPPLQLRFEARLVRRLLAFVGLRPGRGGGHFIHLGVVEDRECPLITWLADGDMPRSDRISVVFRRHRVALSVDSVRAAAPSSSRTPSTGKVRAVCVSSTTPSAMATFAAW